MILTVILLIVSFSAKAAKDTLNFHCRKSIFKNLNMYYWDPSLSWANKYKNSYTSEPRFFLSTTLLVFLTDAYHLFQFISLNSWVLALAINIETFAWYWNFIGIRIIYMIVFNLMFDKILIKK